MTNSPTTLDKQEKEKSRSDTPEWKNTLNITVAALGAVTVATGVLYWMKYGAELQDAWETRNELIDKAESFHAHVGELDNRARVTRSLFNEHVVDYYGDVGQELTRKVADMQAGKAHREFFDAVKESLFEFSIRELPFLQAAGAAAALTPVIKPTLPFFINAFKNPLTPAIRVGSAEHDGAIQQQDVQKELTG